MRVLALDTSTRAGSAALVTDERIVDERLAHDAARRCMVCRVRADPETGMGL